MLLIKSLQLKDFLSHRDTKIDFDSDSKILLDGASGTGKSGIVDSIIWALYGVGRSDNRSLIRKGAKRASVSIKVYEGDKYYTITRTITSTGKHTLEIHEGTEESTGVALSGTEGLRGYQNWIETKLLGASYLLFINSVAYLQNSTDTFVSQTATKRKELLLELVKAGDYDEYYERARELLSNFEIEIQGINTEKKSIVEWVDQANTRTSKKKDIDDAMKKCQGTIKDSEQKKASLISSLERVKGSAEKALLLSKNIVDVETNVERLGVEWRICKDAELQMSKEDGIPTQEAIDNAVETVKLRMKLLDEKPSQHDFAARLVSLRGKLDEYKSIPKCPSGADCPHQHSTVQEIKNIEDEIVEMENKMKDESEIMRKWRERIESLPTPQDIVQMMRLQSMAKSVEKLPQIEEEMASLNKVLSETKEHLSIAASASSIEEKRKIEESLIDVELTLSTARSSEARCAGDLSFIQQLISEIKEKTVRLSDLSNAQEHLDKKIRSLTLVKEAFGSKGIKTVIVDYILPRLEDNVNEVLSRLSDFRIRFDTQKASADGEGTVEGLFITIINETGEELPFENYSGGEKLKITVAISEALASIQKVGFRIFDETFIGLDEVSTESFASVLAKMQESFGQVLCISHLPTIKDMFDKVITLHKKDGISSLDLSTV